MSVLLAGLAGLAHGLPTKEQEHEVSLLAPSSNHFMDDCPSYTGITNQPEDDAINNWCKMQCPGFCPEDKCVCITDAPKRRADPTVMEREPGGAETAAA